MAVLASCVAKRAEEATRQIATLHIQNAHSFLHPRKFRYSNIHCIPNIILQWCAGYSELCDSKSRRLLNIMGGSSELNTDNRHLCADHRFWSQVSCHNYGARWVPALGKSLKELRSTGMRCNGTIQVHFYTLIKIIEILM